MKPTELLATLDALITLGDAATPKGPSGFKETDKERVRFGEAKLKARGTIPNDILDCRGVRFADDHNVQVWDTTCGDGFFVVFEIPTEDDKVSRLQFGITKQAAGALMELLWIKLGGKKDPTISKLAEKLKVAVVALKFIANVDYEELDEPGPRTAQEALTSILEL